MFRYKSGVKVSYTRQGYIYFISRCYQELCEKDRLKIDKLCSLYGGEYSLALRDFVTTDATATEICMKHYISRETLRRAVRRYYEHFPARL